MPLSAQFSASTTTWVADLLNSFVDCQCVAAVCWLLPLVTTLLYFYHVRNSGKVGEVIPTSHLDRKMDQPCNNVYNNYCNQPALI